MQKRGDYVELWKGISEQQKQGYIKESLKGLTSKSFGQVLSMDTQEFHSLTELPTDDSFLLFFLAYI